MRLALALMVWGSLVGCVGDHFFRATGRVLSCGTADPVAAATINARIDQGAAPGPYATVFMTDAAGHFDVRIPDYSDSVITMTFQKTGFTTLSNQFHGSTRVAAELCMQKE